MFPLAATRPQARSARAPLREIIDEPLTSSSPPRVLVQYYKAGLAISDIMAATGLPYQDAYTKLLRGGAQLRPPSQARLARPGTPSAT